MNVAHYARRNEIPALKRTSHDGLAFWRVEGLLARGCWTKNRLAYIVILVHLNPDSY